MSTPYARRALFACAATLTLAASADAQGGIYYDSTLRTFEEAEAYAESLGGHLVSIGSADENQAVQDVLADNAQTRAWIGFNDIASEGAFVWTDGSPVTFTAWNPGEPNNSGDEDCAEVQQSGGWNDITCASLRASLLELPAPPPPSDMEAFGGSVLVFDSQFRSFQNAEAYAQSLGGHLVSIANAAENEAVRQLFVQSGSTQIWIGFNDIASEGAFVWTDGSPVTFTAWNVGEPNNSGGEDCADMEGPGSWNDLPCFYELNSVIEIPRLTDASLGYGTCSASLPAGRAACRVEALATNNLDTGVRYTVFLRVAETGRVAFRGEVKPGAGQTIERLIKFVTIADDPSSFTLELVAEEGSVEAPTGDAFVVDALGFTKGGPMLRATEALAVFPNPTAGAATLRFAVAEQTEASLVVYDALGREVARPVEGTVGGVVEAQLDGADLAAGLYVARLVTAAGAETVRFSVVR